MKRQPTQKHLSLSDRTIIETSLNQGLNFREIADMLGKDPSTISKEVRRHIVIKEGAKMSTRAACRFIQDCTRRAVCNMGCDVICKKKKNCRCFLKCKYFEPAVCHLTKRPPYVCNACEQKNGCRQDKSYYYAKTAFDEYKDILSESRMGANISKDELNRVDELVSPLILKGQPVSHIYAHVGDSLPFGQRTLYTYIDSGLLTARNIDMPRKMKYKPRKKANPEAADKTYNENRHYSDFMTYMERNPETRIVEMDTVIGISGGKALLTMLFRGIGFMLIFLIPNRKQESVNAVFKNLKDALGSEVFKSTFPLFLTDNGTEFFDWTNYLSDDNGELLSQIFFCNSYAAYQKGRIEKNHEYIRMILPKGTSFDKLSQEQVTLITNHINSISRPSLNGCNPYELGLKLLPPALFEVMGLSQIDPDKVTLKPSLLKSL